MAIFSIAADRGAAYVRAASALEACERARDLAICHGSAGWRVYAARRASRSAYGLAAARGRPPNVAAGTLLASGAIRAPEPRASRQGEPKESRPGGFIGQAL